MADLKAHWQYLKYVLRHKWYVLIECWRVGLYWRGIKHDWAKFLPSEWFAYVNFFFRGISSLKSGGSIAKKATPEFEMAWNHHLNFNDHHWQYWVRIGDDGTTKPLLMPKVCQLEMVCDWKGAGKALGKPDTLAWYTINRDKIMLHPETRILVEQYLDFNPLSVEVDDTYQEVGIVR